MEVHRLAARLRVLRRFGLDLCLGHMVSAGDPEPVYVGRLGLTDRAGRRLLVDWRSPAAEPFFGATHANPMGLASRRRYRWSRGRVSDYWDEVFTPDGFDGHAALDDQSAFIASLGSNLVGPDAGRARHHPGRPGRHHPRWIPRRSGRSRRPGYGEDRRPSPCTAPPTSCTPTLASVTAGAACCSSARTSPTWPTSPTSSPASARRACRPAPCGTWSPAEPRQRLRPTRRTWRAAQVLRGSCGHGDRGRPGQVLTRSCPRRGCTVRDPLVLDICAERADDWAEAFVSTSSPATPHNEARQAIWAELLTILTDKRAGDVPAEPAPQVAAAEPGAARGP